MKIQTLGIAVLGMVMLNSCGIFTKEIERRGPVYTETVETGPCYKDVPVFVHKYDELGNVVNDQDGNPVMIRTNKLKRIQIDCYSLDSAFYYDDLDGDGKQELVFYGMDTTWNYDRANSSGDLPDRVISSTQNTPTCSSTSSTQTIIYGNTVPVNPPLRPYRPNARSYYGRSCGPSWWWLWW